MRRNRSETFLRRNVLERFPKPFRKQKFVRLRSRSNQIAIAIAIAILIIIIVITVIISINILILLIETRKETLDCSDYSNNNYPYNRESRRIFSSRHFSSRDISWISLLVVLKEFAPPSSPSNGNSFKPPRRETANRCPLLIASCFSSKLFFQRLVGACLLAVRKNNSRLERSIILNNRRWWIVPKFQSGFQRRCPVIFC